MDSTNGQGGEEKKGGDTMNTKTDQEQPEPELVMYWHLDYWDMPLSGVAMYKGQPVYFQHVEEEEAPVADENADDPEHERPYVEPTYALHALTEAQYRELEAQHDEFGRLVGRHTDHRPGVYQPYADQGTSHLWYDRPPDDQPRLSFSPTQDCPTVATVPRSAFAWFRRPM